MFCVRVVCVCDISPQILRWPPVPLSGLKRLASPPPQELVVAVPPVVAPSRTRAFFKPSFIRALAPAVDGWSVMTYDYQDGERALAAGRPPLAAGGPTLPTVDAGLDTGSFPPEGGM